MIPVKVKTQWNGQVAIRHQYITQAQQQKEGVVIFHDGSSMSIPFEELKKRLVAVSDRPVLDRFNKLPPSYLYYFDWQPDNRQEVLL